MGFDPLSLAVIGTVVSAGSSIMGGIAGQEAGNYKAGVAMANAQIAMQNANYARAAGLADVQKQGIQSVAQQGSIIAQQGASGLAIEGGSATAVRSSAASLGRLGEQNVWDKAQMRAYGYDVEAESQKASAGAAKAEGNNAMVSGILGAMKSIAGNAMSFSDKWSPKNNADIPTDPSVFGVY